MSTPERHHLYKHVRRLRTLTHCNSSSGISLVTCIFRLQPQRLTYCWKWPPHPLYLTHTTSRNHATTTPAAHMLYDPVSCHTLSLMSPVNICLPQLGEYSSMAYSADRFLLQSHRVVQQKYVGKRHHQYHPPPEQRFQYSQISLKLGPRRIWNCHRSRWRCYNQDWCDKTYFPRLQSLQDTLARRKTVQQATLWFWLSNAGSLNEQDFSCTRWWRYATFLVVWVRQRPHLGRCDPSSNTFTRVVRFAQS